MENQNWLKKAADAYKMLTQYDYIFHLGNRKRKVMISIISNQEGEFTHVSGLDHLKDIDSLGLHSIPQKQRVFKKILSEEIKYSDIEKSKYLYKPYMDGFNIARRIKELGNIICYIEENSKDGKFYKWNQNYSRIPNGKCGFVQSQIKADYVLAIPIDEKCKVYIFLKDRKMSLKSQNEPIHLFIISMFASSVDYTYGQSAPYTILAVLKRAVKQRENIEILYCKNTYDRNLVESSCLVSTKKKVKSKSLEMHEVSSKLTLRETQSDRLRMISNELMDKNKKKIFDIER